MHCVLCLPGDSSTPPNPHSGVSTANDLIPCLFVCIVLVRALTAKVSAKNCSLRGNHTTINLNIRWFPMIYEDCPWLYLRSHSYCFRDENEVMFDLISESPDVEIETWILLGEDLRDLEKSFALLGMFLRL